MDDTFVIVGPDGTEHEFPSGMDPKKAAAIVRGDVTSSAQKPEQGMSEERWAGMSAGEKMQNMLKWGGNAIAGAFMPGGAGEQAVENPGTTLAMATVPGVLGAVAKYGGPIASKVVSAATSPAGSATLGAAYGGYTGGVKGAILGGVSGYGAGKLGENTSKVGALLQRMGLSKPPVVDAPLPPALDALMRGASMDELSAVVGSKAAPAAQTGASRLQNEIGSRIDWRTTDAVPIDAIKRDVSNGGSIIEAGESIPGLSDRLAQLLKNPTPSAVKQAEELARAIRQRGHITAKSH